ncbi:MAG: universal stress protein [Rhodospirillaceae bacterium]|nr:universal stress protein [Rhodospirillaceae bacterium]
MYKNILLAVDLNDEKSWKRAVPDAVELVRASSGKLNIMTVIPDFGMSIVGQFFPKNYEKDVAEKVLAALKNFVKSNIPDDIQVRHAVGEGNVYEAILDMAKEMSADLIVVSSGRDDLKDFLLGPNAARIVRHADCSVLVVRN